jgi:hypothetical protein
MESRDEWTSIWEWACRGTVLARILGYVIELNWTDFITAEELYSSASLFSFLAPCNIGMVF